MPLQILSGKGAVQIMPFRKLGGKFHFFLRFCTRKWSKTYVVQLKKKTIKLLNLDHQQHMEFATLTIQLLVVPISVQKKKLSMLYVRGLFSATRTHTICGPENYFYTTEEKLVLFLGKYHGRIIFPCCTRHATYLWHFLLVSLSLKPDTSTAFITCSSMNSLIASYKLSNSYLDLYKLSASHLSSLYNRVFHDLSIIQECQYCQLHFSCVTRNEPDQWSLQPSNVILLYSLISKFTLTRIICCK